MGVPRRDFLRVGLLAAGGAAAVAVQRAIGDDDALASASADPASTGTLALTMDGDLVAVPAGAAASAPPPVPDDVRRGIPGRKWVMVIDLAACDGCGKCVTACADTHFLPPDREWLRLFKMKDSENGAPYWFPRPCFHCDDPPCTRVCPVGATFKRQDGIVLVDNERCIGCRFCMAACPYSARTFNWSHPDNPPEAIARGYSPEWGYPRRIGTTEKCDFCPDMARQGKLPHCAAACPMGAIWFGDENEDAVTNGPDKEHTVTKPEGDPVAKGERQTVRLSQLLRDKGGYRYLEDLGTKPRVYYLPPVNRRYPAPGEPDAKKGAPLRGKQR